MQTTHHDIHHSNTLVMQSRKVVVMQSRKVVVMHPPQFLKCDAPASTPTRRKAILYQHMGCLNIPNAPNLSEQLNIIS